MPKAKSIDINCDMGEDPRNNGNNNDALIMPFISSCNISCGAHSGSRELISETVSLAIAHGNRIGAHPSYPDKVNFGRQKIQITETALLQSIADQLVYLRSIVENERGNISYVKAHGALYHELNKDYSLAHSYISLIKSMMPSARIMGLANGILHEVCTTKNINFISEPFADRVYETESILLDRKSNGALLQDESDLLTQIDQLINSRIKLNDGTIKKINVDSICLHGDHDFSITFAKAIHRYLSAQNIKIRVS